MKKLILALGASTAIGGLAATAAVFTGTNAPDTAMPPPAAHRESPRPETTSPSRTPKVRPVGHTERPPMSTASRSGAYRSPVPVAQVSIEPENRPEKNTKKRVVVTKKTRITKRTLRQTATRHAVPHGETRRRPMSSPATQSAPRATTQPTTTPAPVQTRKPRSSTKTPLPAQTTKSVGRELLALVNTERARHGIPALRQVSAIDTVALRWSTRLSATGSFYHNPNFAQEIFATGATSAGENIAKGSAKPAGNAALARALFTIWNNSPGHRANMLNKDFTGMGIGVTTPTRGGYVAVQTFGRYR